VGLARSISEGSFSQRPFVTSVVPVVGGRPSLPATDDDPFGQFDGLPWKRKGADESKVHFVSIAEADGEDGENTVTRRQTAAGLGVIETIAHVNIEFDLVK
jgi:hypothetical protein